MYLCLLTSEYPPFFGGGIGTYAQHLAEMMTKNGHQVTVLVCDDKRDCVETPKQNLRVVRFRRGIERYSGEGYWLGLSHQFYDELVRLIRNDGEKPDIIEFQEYGAIGWMLLQQKWTGQHVLKDVPTLVHLHTPLMAIHEVNKRSTFQFPEYWIGELEKFSINAADGIVCPSRFLADRVRPLIHRAEQTIHVLPYPFEMSETSHALSCRFDAVYVGRMEYRKGVVAFLEGVERLWEKGIEFTVCMIGGDTWYTDRNCSMTRYFQECYGHRIRQGRLIFIPNTPPDKLREIVGQARFAVVPSLYENFPYTAIEAMHLAKPMLVSSSGGQAEMVGKDESCGLIFDWERGGHFEVQFRRMLEADAATLGKMGESAGKRIRCETNYGDNLIKRCRLYDQVIATANSKRIFPMMDTLWSAPACPAEKSAGKSMKRPGEERASEIPARMSCGDPRETEGDDGGCKLSIIVLRGDPVQRLDKTLAALEMVEYPHEVLIVDSTPDARGAPKGLPQLTRDKPHWRIIEGVPSELARRAGAESADGRFLAFLPAGGWAIPVFYLRAMTLLDRYSNVGLVYSWLKYEGMRENSLVMYNAALPMMLMMKMISPITVVRKRDFLQCCLQEDLDGTDDVLWLRMVMKGYCGIAVPEFLSYLHESEEKLEEERVSLRLSALEGLSRQFPEVYQRYGVEIFNLLNANGPGFYWDGLARGNIFNTVSKEPVFLLNRLFTRYLRRCRDIQRLFPPGVVGLARELLRTLIKKS